MLGWHLLYCPLLEEKVHLLMKDLLVRVVPGKELGKGHVAGK